MLDTRNGLASRAQPRAGGQLPVRGFQAARFQYDKHDIGALHFRACALHAEALDFVA